MKKVRIASLYLYNCNCGGKSQSLHCAIMREKKIIVR